MIPKRTLTATLEISTGSMIITNRPPAFTGEADALHVNITLLDGGIAYEPTGAIQAKLYLYWPGTVNMSEQVDLDIDDNILTGALPDTLTAVPGCPLLVIRLDDTGTGELIVAAATPIQITNVLGERVISSRPATPSEIIYVGRAPYIDETTGHWMEWDVNEGDYVDTLVPAAGSPATFTATATTLPAGSTATASITGTPQNPVLNLGIPRGADGQDSDVLSVNGLTGAVVINGSNASVSSTDDTTIAAKFGQQSDQIVNLDGSKVNLAQILSCAGTITRIGSLVGINFATVSVQLSQNNFITLGTLPEKYWPVAQLYQLYTGNGREYHVRITSSGVVSINYVGGDPMPSDSKPNIMACVSYVAI